MTAEVLAADFGVRLSTTAAPVGLAVTDLVRLALRRNPRRAHLLVSTVLGKHVPVDPRVVVGTGRLLGELVRTTLAGSALPPALVDAARATVLGDDPTALLAALPDPPLAPQPPLVLGFAETATALGHFVAEQLGAGWYLHSTRRDTPGVEPAGRFQEGHSHATDHQLRPSRPDVLVADTVVLVDDEMSTGRTAMGTIVELHRLSPRRHVVLASLIDLRGVEDRCALEALGRELGIRIDTVALAEGVVDLPDDLPAAAARLPVPDTVPAATGALTEQQVWWPVGLPDGGRRELGIRIDTVALAEGVVDLPDDLPAAAARLPVPDTVPAATGALTEQQVWWPVGLPDGGRHGLAFAHHAALHRTVSVAAQQISAALPVTAGRVLVLGTEEFMAVPALVAARLAGPDRLVRFQSTTRSPVHPWAGPDYPVRRAFTFPAVDSADGQPRFVYNLTENDGVEPDLVVLLVDAAADPPSVTSGPVAALRRAGLAVHVVRLAAVTPEPLTGPDFGSYAADEVRWLLTDLSHLDLEGDVAQRERAIQSGRAHYAESLPQEFQPEPAYYRLFADVLAESAPRLARAVGLVTELVLAERGPDLVLASLARAGTPVGILMRRWAAWRHGLDLPHYAVSIVRGRGIDRVALDHLAAHHDPGAVVFVDGWTGKGAIARELTAALDAVAATGGPRFSDDLAVLADPGECVRTFGTRDDFLIASACLNSTVSGLVSRTVLNPAYLRPDQFHGAKFYREFADSDVSATFLDTVTTAFAGVADQVREALPALRSADRTPTFAGWAAIEAIRAEYGIDSVNFVKPGVGETTRVLLRRIPWRILLRSADHPDHRHLRVLAAERRVAVEIRPDLPYSCVGLIRPLSADDRGEG